MIAQTASDINLKNKYFRYLSITSSGCKYYECQVSRQQQQARQRRQRGRGISKWEQCPLGIFEPQQPQCRENSPVKVPGNFVTHQRVLLSLQYVFRLINGIALCLDSTRLMTVVDFFQLCLFYHVFFLVFFFRTPAKNILIIPYIHRAQELCSGIGI